MELDIKYHAAENLFRSFWIDFLEKQLSNKDLDTHQVIDVDGDQILRVVDLVDDAVLTDSDAPVIAATDQLLSATGAWLLTQGDNGLQCGLKHGSW